MQCPICKKPTLEPPLDGPIAPFPFCSERCRLVDLGRWLDEKYQIPACATDEDEPADEGAG